MGVWSYIAAFFKVETWRAFGDFLLNGAVAQADRRQRDWDFPQRQDAEPGEDPPEHLES